ncbi:MAG: NADPH-dependent assimilatory sulfite reductase hemoprotein subunit [Pirellulales bacterium]|nr:NADPH-dependent assimilatory sulfite reductase hemoprotein subunit [Pirellulales bacterium]
MADPVKLSKVEAIKTSSNYLRGRLLEELADAEASFSEDTVQLIKHHGMYQQDDRDLRGVKGPDGKKLGKAYSLMVRVKVPGGKLTSGQFLAQLDLCDELGNATARITDRQDIQLHGVLKQNVKQTIRRINEIQLTTLGACGDVERNVMCCPAPLRNSRVHDQIQEMAKRVSDHLLPQTTAYHEVWLTDPVSGEKELLGGGSDGHQIEPIYGSSYLPRKFKTAIALAEDNCIDAYANDLGLLAITRDGDVAGYNVLVGGGFGVTPSNKNTFPALAQPMAYVTPDQVLDVATAIIKVQRDFGDRSDRKRARMKYLIFDWGLEKFKAKVEEYYGGPLPAPLSVQVTGFDDHIGWHPQGDGRWYYGLNVENGRILDREGFRLKTALREVCRAYQPGIRLTAHQSILFSDFREEDRAGLEEILRRHGVKLHGEISNARRWSMACVALPTCPLAVTESERVMPGLIDQLEAELARLGLAEERFTVRMTGCPNGCSRPYNADIGIVGKTANKYTIFLGGRLFGDRMASLYKDLVPFEEIVPTLVPILTSFRQERHPGESLGDFCHRKGADALRAFSDHVALADA